MNAKNVDKAIDRFLAEYFRKNNEPELTRALLEPTIDLLKRGGKRWRPLLMETVYHACGGKRDISKFYPVIELIHSGTLIHDDIEDNSEKRRGKKALHLVYGEDVAINLGAWMYFAVFQIINKANASQAVKQRLTNAMIEELENCHKGQAMDIYWHSTDIVPSEKNYLTMCALKTGSLARLAARFGAILACRNEKTEKLYAGFATSLGIAFQIQDDVLNISGKVGKDFGDDITEGKKSLPVIYCLATANVADRKELLRILKLKTANKKIITEALKLIIKNNSRTYANNVAKKLINNSWKNINNKVRNLKVKKELEKLKNFVTERDF